MQDWKPNSVAEPPNERDKNMLTNVFLGLAMLIGTTLSEAHADGIVTTREIIQDKRIKPFRTCQRTGAVDVRLGAIGIRSKPLLHVAQFQTVVNPLTGFEIRPEAWLDPTDGTEEAEPVDWWSDATPVLRLRAQSGDVLFHAFFPPGPKTVATINGSEQFAEVQAIRPRNKVAIVNHIWLLVSGQAYRMHKEAGATEQELTDLAINSGTTVAYCTSRIQWEVVEVDTALERQGDSVQKQTVKKRRVKGLKAKY